MPRIECSRPDRKGNKVCKFPRPGGIKEAIEVRSKATAASRRRRNRNLAKGRKFRFTKADARACAKHKSSKARGKCMARRVKARV